MITNFLFFSYMIFMCCSVPLSIGLQHAHKNHKGAWAESVIFVATRHVQLICVEEQCIPVGQSIGAGTSFVIDKKENQTIIMTAAHLCYPYQSEPQSLIDGMGRLESSFDLSIVFGESMMIVEDILMVDIENDICIFSVPINIGREIPISKKNPVYGDIVWSIGAPAGYFPESAKPITQGIFSGEAERKTIDGSTIEFFNFSMPTIGGMSGSPIISDDGELVGIVSAVSSDWHMVSFSPTLDQIKEAIEDIRSKI